MHGYRVLTFRVYNCHDSHAYSYKRSGILTGLVGIGYRFGYGWEYVLVRFVKL